MRQIAEGCIRIAYLPAGQRELEFSGSDTAAVACAGAFMLLQKGATANNERVCT